MGFATAMLCALEIVHAQVSMVWRRCLLFHTLIETAAANTTGRLSRPGCSGD